MKGWPARIGRALRSRWAADPLFTALCGGLLLLYLLPLLLTRHLPLQDYAAHLRVAAILRAIGTDAGLMASCHELNGGFSSYAAYYYLLWGMGTLMSLEAAQRLIIALYIVAVPCGAAYLLGAFGRDRRYALLSFPFVYNSWVIIGLLAQAFTLPLLLFGLGLLKRYLDGPNLRRELTLAGLACVLHLTHFVGFVTFGLAALVVFFAHARGLRQVLRRGLWALPSLAIALLWSGGLLKGEGLELHFAPLTESMKLIPDWLIDIYLGQLDEVVLIGLFATAMVGYLRQGAEGPPAAGQWSLAGAGLALLLALFALPLVVLKPAVNFPTNVRLALPGVLLLTLAPRAPLKGRQLWAIAPALLLVAGFGVLTVKNFVAFDRMARHIDPLLDVLPADRRVLQLRYHAGDDIHRGLPLLHLGELYQVRKGGFIPDGMVGWGISPVRIKGPWSPGPRADLAHDFRYAAHGGYYHYFLVTLAPGVAAERAFPGARPGEVRLVRQSGRFALYENVGPLRPR